MASLNHITACVLRSYCFSGCATTSCTLSSPFVWLSYPPKGVGTCTWPSSAKHQLVLKLRLILLLARGERSTQAVMLAKPSDSKECTSISSSMERIISEQQVMKNLIWRELPPTIYSALTLPHVCVCLASAWQRRCCSDDAANRQRGGLLGSSQSVCVCFLRGCGLTAMLLLSTPP